MRNINKNTDPRSGTVLILVLGILAVLMVLAASLALTTRVEMRSTEYYESDQLLQPVIEAVENYSLDYLYSDRYEPFRSYDPASDVFYHFDRHALWVVDSEFDVTDPSTGWSSDVTKAYLLADGVQDNEWLGTETVEDIPGVFTMSRAGDEVELGARYLLNFEDVGGSRLDVNMTGNTDATNHDENEGETTFRTRLNHFLDDDVVDLILDYREYNEADFYGYDDSSSPAQFDYNPDYPVGSYYPFSAGELFELAWADNTDIVDSDSLAASLPEAMEDVDPGNWPQHADWVTTASAGNIVTTMSINNLEADFGSDNYQHVMEWTESNIRIVGVDAVNNEITIAGDWTDYIENGYEIKVLDVDGNEITYDVTAVAFDFGYTTIGLNSPPSSDDRYVVRYDIIARPLPQIIRTLSEGLDDPEVAVGVLADFLTYIDGIHDFHVTENAPAATQEEIVEQIALNIWNLTTPDVEIEAVDTGSNQLTISGEWSDQIAIGAYISVRNSTGNDGFYTVDNVTFDGNNTVITVDQDVTNSAVDGQIKLNVVYKWNDYYGIIPGESLYVAEIAPVVDSSRHAYVPDVDGEIIDGSGDLLTDDVVCRKRITDGDVAELLHGYGINDPTNEYIWYDRTGIGDFDRNLDRDHILRDDDDTDEPDTAAATILQPSDNPKTGWGKYIKLFNPWEDEIDFDNPNYEFELEIEFDGLKWEINPNDGDSAEWVEVNLPNEVINIELEGNIPGKGHFLIIDAEDFEDAEAGFAVEAVFDNLPPDNYQVDHRLTYLTEVVHNIKLTWKHTATGEEIVLMETIPGDLGLVPDADDGSERNSVQIFDPRPCWIRNGIGHEVWEEDVWDEEDKSAIWVPGAPGHWHWESDDTKNIGWFNHNWRVPTPLNSGDDSLPIMTGDNWHKLHASSLSLADQPDNSNNLLDSFFDSDDLPDTFFSNPIDLTYVHSGIPWGTLSYSDDIDALNIEDLDQVVFLSGLSRFLLGNSPNEYGLEGDPIYDEINDPEIYDRLNEPVRLHGRVNVNTAPEEVLGSVISESVIEDWEAASTAVWWDASDTEDIIQEIAAAIVEERPAGGYENLDHLFDSVTELYGLKSGGWDFDDTGVEEDLLDEMPNTPLRHAMARSLYNRITVRSDVWGVTGRVQMYEFDGTVRVENGHEVVLISGESFDTDWDPANDDQIIVAGIVYDIYNVIATDEMELTENVELRNVRYSHDDGTEYNGVVNVVWDGGNNLWLIDRLTGDAFDVGWTGKITIAGQQYDINNVSSGDQLTLDEDLRLNYAGCPRLSVLSDRAIYMVIDRSFLTPRVLFRTELPLGN